MQIFRVQDLEFLVKKPDLKSKMTVEMAKGLADLQRQILTVVHNYVKPGGKLLYSTCTINREENEDNTAWFVENFPEFEKIREKQMLPGSDMGDGFYIAEFRKTIDWSKVMEKKDIVSYNYDELQDEIKSIGEKPFRAKQIYAWHS